MRFRAAPAARADGTVTTGNHCVFLPHAWPAPEQQDRDKYECNTWAVQQSGFDPSLPNVPPHLHVLVSNAGPPPGSGIAAGAVTGAFLAPSSPAPGKRDPEHLSARWPARRSAAWPKTPRPSGQARNWLLRPTTLKQQRSKGRRGIFGGR